MVAKMDQNKLKELSEDYPLNPAVPEDIPKPTFWPIMLAFGVLFLFWGFVTSFILSVVGIAGIGISISGWIGEFYNE